ncbi:MAG: hypothetical protein R3F07_17065 [Opitutaceae bacterium]
MPTRFSLIHTALVTLAVVSLTSPVPATPTKPTIWVTTDLSDPRTTRSGGHPNNDPDDICSLAALLLEANRFDIAAVVYSSTNRQNLPNATDFVQSAFAAAYAHDVPFLNAAFGGFQPEIPFIRSSLTRHAEPIRFDPDRDYSDLSELETVAALVDLAARKPVHVLSWGPLTESAIAVKHCLDTGQPDVLANLFIISHWTKSWIAQGTPETPFHVANCRDDARACDFLHTMAGQGAGFRFVELGSVGQTGVVNGAAGYPGFGAFQGSRLGQIFIHAKFYHGKPDQSDGATFWLMTGQFGPTLSDYPDDGSLDQATEERGRDLFLENGHQILDDLRRRSDAAAAANDPFPPGFLASRFTYVYQYLNGRYYIHVPLEATFEIRDATGRSVMSGRLQPGDHELDFSRLAPGDYPVTIKCGGLEIRRSLTRTAESP